MYVFRPITEADEANFISMALHTPFALTSMPKDILLIQNKIERAILSFQSNTKSSDEGQYLFVLEHVATGEIVGISALYTNVGFNSPIYYYRIVEEERSKVPDQLSPFLMPQKLLKVMPAGEGSTEIGTLYLNYNHRKEGLGPLLSFSRFLFAAAFPHLFADKIHANMRGVFDDKGNPPFWEYFGRHFFNVDYNTLIDLTQHDRNLAHHLLPTHPIYLDMIPKEAREVIGKTHANTVPAMKMLSEQGFQWNMHIDTFDAGPLIFCNTNEIRTIAQSRVARIKSISNVQSNAKHCLVATHKQSFRSCYGNIELLDDNDVTIDETAACCLNVQTGHQIRFIPLKSGEPPNA